MSKFENMNYADFRQLAKKAYEDDRTDDALEYFKIAYQMAVLEFGNEPVAADDLAEKARNAWTLYHDDDAYDYYKAAYNLVVA